LYKILLTYFRKLLNNNKQLNIIDVISRTRLIYIQTNCSRNFDNRFLSIIVVAIVATIVVALAFAFAFAFVLAFVFFALTLVSFISFALFFASLSSIIILLAFVAFLDFLLNRNIKRTCELKEIKIKLTIYNNNLILLLRICFRVYFVCCVSSSN